MEVCESQWLSDLAVEEKVTCSKSIQSGNVQMLNIHALSFLEFETELDQTYFIRMFEMYFKFWSRWMLSYLAFCFVYHVKRLFKSLPLKRSWNFILILSLILFIQNELPVGIPKFGFQYEELKRAHDQNFRRRKTNTHCIS